MPPITRIGPKKPSSIKSKLAICLQVCPKDCFLGLRLVKLICSIEPKKRSDIEFIVSARRDTNPITVQEIAVTAEAKFESVQIVHGKRFGTGWPMGCNDLWQETMMRVSMMVGAGKLTARGVLTFEADCLPLRPDWLDRLIDEWEIAQKKGKLVCGHAHLWTGRPDEQATHINGNAIFAYNVTSIFGELNGCDSKSGWDAYHGKLLLSIGYDSVAICQKYRIPRITRVELEEIRKRGQIPAMFHGIKGETGLQAVEEMVADGGFFTRHLEQEESTDIDADYTGDPSTAIFIKSYPGDFEWLGYCLDSIRKRAKGFSEVVLVLPDNCTFPVQRERIIHLPECGDGYQWQMFVKMTADRHTKADCILYIDSDCILTREFQAAEMFDGGQPMLARRTWGEAGTGIAWKEGTEKALGFESEFDTMTCHPSIYRRTTLQRVRRHIETLHGYSLDEYILAHKGFSEFVTVGNYILRYEPEKYTVIEPRAYPHPLKQFWSKDVPPRPEIETLLK